MRLGSVPHTRSRRVSTLPSREPASRIYIGTIVSTDMEVSCRYPDDSDVSHQTMDRIRRIPVINQIASQFLTLQSAIAHTDMPKATGPTCFMPYSQTFDKGYIAVRDQRYIDYVKPRMAQVELQKGDAVFFNPATFHQPGVNTTDNERIANLLQVSSPFGRSMESTDRLAMARAIWPVVKKWQQEISAGKSQKTASQLDAVIAAACSDYGYPKIFDMIVSFWNRWSCSQTLSKVADGIGVWRTRIASNLDSRSTGEREGRRRCNGRAQSLRLLAPTIEHLSHLVATARHV